MKSCFALLGLGTFLAALTVGAQPMSVSDGVSQGEASLEEIARGIPDFLAHLADHSSSRRLSSPLDKMEVLIKNVDCFACMEAPPPPVLRHLRAEDEARELSPGGDVFVNALNCDTNDPYQIWNLLSLEPTGTWFLFESAETGECMQLVGLCNPSGANYDIEMGPCDPTNGKAFWAFTGVGAIVHYECLRSTWESDTLHHSTPDIFLEASCGNTGGLDYLDLSSHSADSIDQVENFWMLYPKTFGTLVPP